MNCGTCFYWNLTQFPYVHTARGEKFCSYLAVHYEKGPIVYTEPDYRCNNWCSWKDYTEQKKRLLGELK